jgi:hypothetical protein
MWSLALSEPRRLKFSSDLMLSPLDKALSAPIIGVIKPTGEVTFHRSDLKLL